MIGVGDFVGLSEIASSREWLDNLASKKPTKEYESVLN